MSDCWHGCYAGGWQGEIVPEAFAHPAKVSRSLIRRIYEHAFAEGWLRAGNVEVTQAVRDEIEKEIANGQYQRL